MNDNTGVAVITATDTAARRNMVTVNPFGLPRQRGEQRWSTAPNAYVKLVTRYRIGWKSVTERIDTTRMSEPSTSPICKIAVQARRERRECERMRAAP